MNTARPVVYYITAHGYGHGIRSSDIIRAFMERHPEVPVRVVSDLPVHILQNRIGFDGVQFRPGSFDVGVIQLDSIRMDIPASLDRLEGLQSARAESLKAEIDYLHEQQAGVVVADIPGLPIAAAEHAGIPVLAVSNFSWDWIYEPFRDRDPRWETHIRQFREDYGKADLLLRLPFHHEMESFKRKEDFPVVVKKGESRREDLAAMFNCDLDKKWVLLSFTTLDWDERALEEVQKLEAYEFFSVRPLAWDETRIHGVDRTRIPFLDVLASADVVVSKPGFGIVSECAVSRTPLVYAERENFCEYPLMVRGIQRYIRNQHIPAEDLYRGDLGPALEAIAEAPDPPELISGGGAEMVAARISDFYPW